MCAAGTQRTHTTETLCTSLCAGPRAILIVTACAQLRVLMHTCAHSLWLALAWPLHAQAQLMNAQGQPYLISPRRPPQPQRSIDMQVWAMMSIHEVGLSMPEPLLSLSMLILVKSGEARSKSLLTKGRVRSQNNSLQKHTE